ncbi:hypothetical protein PLESTM_000243600 [Pleodorina starrii]|nr:hypothetical protein PLESTM_000243600 [Pleodorina starrii]
MRLSPPSWPATSKPSHGSTAHCASRANAVHTLCHSYSATARQLKTPEAQPRPARPNPTARSPAAAARRLRHANREPRASCPTAPMADDAQRAKWEQYYAADPRAAPWDTHSVSSQLRSYLSDCPARGAAAATEPPAPAAASTPPERDAAAGSGRGSSSGGGGGGCGDGGGAPGPGLHICALCAPLKPEPRPSAGSGGDGGSGGGRRGGVRALELCCGTGASLAFMRGLGFSVVGVDLVEAACEVAAERLAAVAGAPVAVQPVEAVAEALRSWDADDDAAAAAAAAAEGGLRREGTAGACVACGDLFGAGLPRGFFDFAYDCQGLHAMPPALRPAYEAVLRDALRVGGLALLLVGRAEEDEEEEQSEGQEDSGRMEVDAPAAPQAPSPAVDAAAAAAAAAATGCREGGNGARGSQGGDSGSGSGCEGGGGGVPAGRGGTDPRVGGPSASSSRGPSLMTRQELRALFGVDSSTVGQGSMVGEESAVGRESMVGEERGRYWEWCWCRPTRFDSTSVYARLPRPPPAWCLLVRRR